MISVKKRSSGWRWIITLSVMCFAALFNLRCGENKSDEEMPKYASLDPSNSYVGMNTCKDCHSDIYETYIETGMGKSFDLASVAKSSADFSKHSPVYDHHLDYWYFPYWENDSLRIMEYRLDGKDTIHKRIETITYIVGSGNHTNSHIINTNGYLNQAPLTFYTQKGMWDLPPGYENGGNTRFNRLIGLECMSCHNSYPVFEPGSENKYHFVDNGISCERCHGPGEKHVTEKRAGKLFDTSKEIDYSIVNPAKLPIDRQLDVCQRCHIQGNAVLNDGKSFFDFKPGMKLSDVMNVFMPVYKGSEKEHIMASHVERMKLSKCYTVSIKRAEQHAGNDLRPYKNALTCVTCHNPHVSVKQTGPENFNKSCQGCHSKTKDPVCSEKPEILKLNSFNCVSCHMPASGATDIPHVSVHDHFIRIPLTEEETEKIREFVGINCINNPDVDQVTRGKAFIAYYEKFGFTIDALDSARKYIPGKTKLEIGKNFRHLIHLEFVSKNYRAVVSYAKSVPSITDSLRRKSFDNTDAWTAYRIGASFLELGDQASCEKYYSISYKLAPDYPEFANKYAISLLTSGKSAEARKILEKSVKDYPKFPATLSNLGYIVLTLDGDTVMARQYYDKALSLDPDYGQGVVNKAGLLMATGKKNEAVALLKRFLKKNYNFQAANDLLARIEALK